MNLEPVLDLCGILKALHHNDVRAGLSSFEGSGFRVFIGDEKQGVRMETVFPASEIRHAAGWLKRSAVHLWGVGGIDWDKGKWEIRK